MRLYDDHYIHGKWVDCKSAIPSKELAEQEEKLKMKSKKVIDQPTAQQRENHLQEFFDQ